MSDDEIEIVGERVNGASRPASDDICQLCSCKFNGLSTADREEHYELEHGSGLPSRTRSRRARTKPTSAQRKTTPMKLRNPASEDVFWCPAQAAEPPENYSPGILSVLKEALKISHKNGTAQRAVLCYERTPHIHNESFDISWGCGYRNFLMACAALMDQQIQTFYFPNLDSPFPPGVRNLQRWLEDAWKNGYDDIGARELEHKLIDTKKKIGTAELYVAFTSRKIPCGLVDYNVKESKRGFDAVTEWVKSYFTPKPTGDVNTILRGNLPVVATDKMPVILQYDGHSVTIVGYELAKNGKCNLLVFNPSSKIDKTLRQDGLSMSPGVWASSASPNKGLSAFRKRSPDPNNGIVNIPSSDEEEIDELDDNRKAVPLKSAADADKVIKSFRFKVPRNKDAYQLLYFTMDAPLTDEEQNNRKVVFSVREC